MEFRNITRLIICISFIGCAPLRGHQPVTSDADDSYEQGYRKGISENIHRIVDDLNGNEFPYLGNWTEPIVQDVSLPAHIQNGVFYPESIQPVLIAPGQWKRNAVYPINCRQRHRISVPESSEAHPNGISIAENKKPPELQQPEPVSQSQSKQPKDLPQQEAEAVNSENKDLDKTVSQKEVPSNENVLQSYRFNVLDITAKPRDYE